MLFKFEIQFNVEGFASRANAREKAIDIVNHLADVLSLFGIKMTAKEIEVITINRHNSVH